MADRITVTTRTGFFTRIKNALTGIGVGILLILGAIVLLFWNEGRAVTTARTLAEGAGAVVTVSPDRVDPANEGRLIHLSGAARTAEPLADPQTGIAAQGLRLERRVEMYQWIEERESSTRTRVGGGQETVTTYTYRRDWSSSAVDSARFQEPNGHRNPPFSIEGRTVVAQDARLGAYMLSPEIAGRVPGAQELIVSRDAEQRLRQAFGAGRAVSVQDGGIYLGYNPSAPSIGDTRIRYEVVPAGDVSIVAAQRGSGLGAYRAEAGGSILLVDAGLKPASEMFDDAVRANTFLTWMVRLAGFVLLTIGFGMLFAPLGVLADIIPPIGGLVRMGTGFAGFILAALVGTLTIAVAWFTYRPLLSLAIFGGGALIAAGLAYLRRGRAAERAPA
ncbi:MAG: TMEM43 family protein [Hyphomicrobiaceae bacterium]|nr:TMEM43 family protein [Hyphomicrobiaceae bacterium]